MTASYPLQKAAPRKAQSIGILYIVQFGLYRLLNEKSVFTATMHTSTVFCAFFASVLLASYAVQGLPVEHAALALKSAFADSQNGDLLQRNKRQAGGDLAGLLQKILMLIQLLKLMNPAAPADAPPAKQDGGDAPPPPGDGAPAIDPALLTTLLQLISGMQSGSSGATGTTAASGGAEPEKGSGSESDDADAGAVGYDFP